MYWYTRLNVVIISHHITRLDIKFLVESKIKKLFIKSLTSDHGLYIKPFPKSTQFHLIHSQGVSTVLEDSNAVGDDSHKPLVTSKRLKYISCKFISSAVFQTAVNLLDF